MTELLKPALTATAVALGLLLAGPAMAQQGGMQPRNQPVYGSDTVYGWQIMTPQERDQYRMEMRNAATQEERERIRAEHHEQMRIRAETQGATLPDVPPENRGMGKGMGTGQGMGMNKGQGVNKGQGMGQGMGQGAGQGQKWKNR